LHVHDRSAGQLALASGRGEFHQSLDPVDRNDAAAHMVDKDQPSARLEDALHLEDRPSLVRHAAHRVRAQHGIERTVVERERLRVASQNVTSIPRSAARLRASASISGVRSIPVRRTPGG
jgi:hypothetical protein